MLEGSFRISWQKVEVCSSLQVNDLFVDSKNQLEQRAVDLEEKQQR